MLIHKIELAHRSCVLSQDGNTIASDKFECGICKLYSDKELPLPCPLIAAGKCICNRGDYSGI